MFSKCIIILEKYNIWAFKMSEQRFLYQKIMKYLAGLIVENLQNPQYKLPAELELTKTQNVSRMTVRKAFKEFEELGLIHRVRGNGTFISENATKELLIPFLQDPDKSYKRKIATIFPLFDESRHIVKIFSSILKSAPDMRLFISSSNMSIEREQELINDYLKMDVDGIIVYPVDNNIYNKTLLQLSMTDFPLVLVDRHLPGLTIANVSSDHHGMGKNAASFLLKNGHSHILFFNANEKTNSALTSRQEGYHEALNEVKNYHRYLFTFCGDLDPTSQSFIESFYSYLQEHPQITAIITADYSSSIHLKQIFKQFNPPAEKEYDVVFLDTKYTDRLTPGINATYMPQNAAKIGKKAIDLFRKAFEGFSIKNENVRIPVPLNFEN